MSNVEKKISAGEEHSFFHRFLADNAQKQSLVVQPRMGFSDFASMRNGLERVAQLNAPTIGTITLDSFTRTRDLRSAALAVKEGHKLNGYPIVTYSKESNQKLIEGLQGKDFPIQVRHGSSQPEHIFEALLEMGIDATEGGPISYCFPYSKVALKDSVHSWRVSCEMMAAEQSFKGHIESFGGCMMGQLCPPAMLIAISTIEALFFKKFGVRSYSLSMAQGTHFLQDVATVKALRQIGNKYLGDRSDWHIVYYTFMGKFPETALGAKALSRDSVQIAKAGGAQRLIVKTEREAHQIPTIEDNLEALTLAHQTYVQMPLPELDEGKIDGLTQAIFAEADFLIDLLLNLSSDLEKAIVLAFQKGYWDVPFCLHPDNPKAVSAKLDAEGKNVWASSGKIPFPKHILKNNSILKHSLSSQELVQMLSFNKNKYDAIGRSIQEQSNLPGNIYA